MATATNTLANVRAKDNVRYLRNGIFCSNAKVEENDGVYITARQGVGQPRKFYVSTGREVGDATARIEAVEASKP